MKKDVNQSVNRRKMPRFALSWEQFKLLPEEKIFGVHDLSVNGFGLKLLTLDDHFFFPIQRKFEGTLKIKDRKISLKAVVKHITPQRIGAEFVDLDSTSKTWLENLFNPVSIGKSLKSIPADGLNVQYQGDFGASLLAERGVDGQWTRLLVTMPSGHWVEWKQESGIDTNGESSEIIPLASEIIEQAEIPETTKSKWRVFKV